MGCRKDTSCRVKPRSSSQGQGESCYLLQVNSALSHKKTNAVTRRWPRPLSSFTSITQRACIWADSFPFNDPNLLNPTASKQILLWMCFLSTTGRKYIPHRFGQSHLATACFGSSKWMINAEHAVLLGAGKANCRFSPMNSTRTQLSTVPL